MSETLIVIARVEAEKDKADVVKKAALKLIDPTRSEQGCLRYELNQDNDHPEILIFVETWQSKAMLDAHRASAHLTSFVEEVDGFLASLTVNEMSCIA